MHHTVGFFNFTLYEYWYPLKQCGFFSVLTLEEQTNDHKDFPFPRHLNNAVSRFPGIVDFGIINAYFDSFGRASF